MIIHIILSPGDSGFKIVQLVELMYKTGDETYEYNIGNKTIKKHLQIVSFPISSITHTSNLDPTGLDNYIRQVIHTNNITSFDNLLILDHVESGSSYKTLVKSFRRISGNIKLKIPYINTDDIWVKTGTDNSAAYSALISDSENVSNRCAPEFNIGKDLIHLNMIRCNVTLSMSYLLALGRLDFNLEFPSLSNYQIDFLTNVISDTVKITYYDSELSDLNTTIGYISTYYGDKVLFEYIDQTGYKSRLTSFNALSLVSIDVLNFPTITYDQLHSFKDQFIQVTLINNKTLIGWYNNSMLYFGLDSIGLSHQLISNIKPMTFNKSIINFTPYLLTISNITYLDNGELTTKIFYITMVEKQVIRCIEPKYFINTTIHTKTITLSKDIIFNIELIRSGEIKNLSSCYCTVQYLNNNVVSELTDNWVKFLYSPYYYMATTSSVNIIPPLILSIEPASLMI